MPNRDQASNLRRKVQATAVPAAPNREPRTTPDGTAVSPTPRLHTIAVTGGKGGVGKTNIAVNLALTIAQLGGKVGILDADLGLANVDMLFRLNPRYTLKHVLTGEKTIEEILLEGPLGVSVIPASSGIQALANLPESNRRQLIAKLSHLAHILDILIIDTPAGIGDNVMSFVLAANEVVVVTTPDPLAYTDAYALIKLISQKEKRRINLVVNMVRSVAEAREVAEILEMVTKKFKLNISELSFASYLPYDAKFRHALRKQVPFILEYPESRSAKCLLILAKKLLSVMTRNSHRNDFFANVEAFQSNQMAAQKQSE
ncbi:MAG: MinD/ParA family protein [Candidatus Poribacteria bacterium]|nr:MinD/ParA family protein [Candidatus Poribacteria bacterium]